MSYKRWFPWEHLFYITTPVYDKLIIVYNSLLFIVPVSVSDVWCEYSLLVWQFSRYWVGQLQLWVVDYFYFVVILITCINIEKMLALNLCIWQKLCISLVLIFMLSLSKGGVWVLRLASVSLFAHCERALQYKEFLQSVAPSGGWGGTIFR